MIKCIGPDSMICNPPLDLWQPKTQTIRSESKSGCLLHRCGAGVPELSLPFAGDFWVGHRCLFCLVALTRTATRKTLQSLTATGGLVCLIAKSCDNARLRCP